MDLKNMAEVQTSTPNEVPRLAASYPVSRSTAFQLWPPNMREQGPPRLSMPQTLKAKALRFCRRLRSCARTKFRAKTACSRPKRLDRCGPKIEGGRTFTGRAGIRLMLALFLY